MGMVLYYRRTRDNGMDTGWIQDIGYRMELEMEHGIGWDGWDIGEFIDRLGKGLLGKLPGQGV